MREYYHTQFRQDLLDFMGDSTVPYFGHGWHYSCRQVDRVPRSRRAQFLICLYFTVLVDQAMYTYFREDYSRFEELTRYPKFCHGLGQFQQNPRGILLEPVTQAFINPQEMKDLLPAGMQLFVEEVVDFLTAYMPHVSAQKLFCNLLYDPDVQIPGLLLLLEPQMKDDVDCVAYECLRNAVDAVIQI